MSSHRCPGCGAAAQKTIEGNHLRWLEPEPHTSGNFIVLEPAEDGKTPQSRWAGMLDDDETPRFHLHACDLVTAAEYAAAQRRAPTRRSGRLARQRAAAKGVDRGTP